MRRMTGSGLRQPGLMLFTREALTWMKGLIPRIFTVAVKLAGLILIVFSGRDVTTRVGILRLHKIIRQTNDLVSLRMTNQRKAH